jgi:hypothetical protein
MSSEAPPIVPLQPYFATSKHLTETVAAVYEMLGAAIQARGYIYNRATFYTDLALVIRFIVESDLLPFAWSSTNWQRWADWCEDHAAELGADPAFTMQLPPPRSVDPYLEYPQITNQVDHVVTFMLGVYKQEEDDLSSDSGGEVTLAECVKLTARFARYILPDYCYDIVKPHPQHVTWKWARAVAEELGKLYRALGEENVAGGWGPGGGEIPPVSWPQP